PSSPTTSLAIDLMNSSNNDPDLLDISRKLKRIESIGSKKLVVGLDGGNNSKPSASANTFLSSSCK
ncbi:unnamed protein product, partial [Adineta steineri]